MLVNRTVSNDEINSTTYQIKGMLYIINKTGWIKLLS